MADEGDRARLNPFAGIPDRAYELSAAELLRSLGDAEGPGWKRWRKQTSNAPIVQVEDRYITGRFDVRAAELGYLFKFERCRFEYPPDVREATLLGLVFRSCWLPGLKARNLRSRNDVRIIRCTVDVEPGDKPDHETTVRRAGVVDRGVPDAAVNLTDAVIEGSVVLTRTRINYPRGKAIQADRLVITGALLAYRLQAGGEVRIPGMKVGGNVNFSGASLRNPEGLALNGNGLHIGGSLLCEKDKYGKNDERRVFTAKGVLYLPSARIDSDIVLREARLEVDQNGPLAIDSWDTGDPYVDPHPALVADRLRVDGNVDLDELRSVGTLRMVNAAIGGSLRLAKAQVTVQRRDGKPHYDRAIHLDGSQIDGDLQATRLYAQGQLRLADVQIRGNVLASRAHLLHRDRDVFSARRTRVSGNLHMVDAAVSGTMRLQGIEVGGSVDLYGTQVSHPNVTDTSSFSVDLRTAKVGRDIVLTANRVQSAGVREFRADGGVNMDGAQVARRVNLTGAVLGTSAAHDVALDVGDVAADEFLLTPSTPPAGRVILRRARCGTLDDNPAFWRAAGKIELEDFRYDAMSTPIAMEDDEAVENRIGLLHDAMDGYRPGPYDQLATMLRASGNEEHADTVLMRKQQFRYETLARGYGLVRRFGLRVWSWAQRLMVGYGYRPMRAVAWLLMLLVLGSLWFGLRPDTCTDDPELLRINDTRCAVNSDDTGLEWDPVFYTLDLLVPIVDFGNKGRWHMAGADKAVSAGFTSMGWILATTVAAGVTRTLRRNG
ncbi:oxidoreductase [Amycolatopsis antarctica]|uniref:Oxidoreductase n=1 Tax=Amycolatopsis antarctica TaxID=1854586 RepID=A0A263D2U9_9PSEU|nr:oxidoreductase [Amycolatopsis antarctica]OZM72780.1 oxidoreductase [Amycolatopsis antarctica]